MLFEKFFDPRRILCFTLRLVVEKRSKLLMVYVQKKVSAEVSQLFEKGTGTCVGDGCGTMEQR